MPHAAINTALEPLRTMLAADGYELEIRDEDESLIVAEIKAGPEACAECLVPKDIMRAHFESALRAALAGDVPAVKLIYPADV
jgi:hypothetical protein